MYENPLFSSCLHHLLSRNLSALRLQKFWAQPHRVDQIPFNVPHGMRDLRKHIRFVLEPEHLFQNLEPLHPLREVDQARSRKVPIIRRYGVWIPVADLSNLAKPHPDVRHAGALRCPNGSFISGESICWATKGQKVVQDGAFGRVGPGLIQTRNDVAPCISQRR